MLFWRSDAFSQGFIKVYRASDDAPTASARASRLSSLFASFMPICVFAQPTAHHAMPSRLCGSHQAPAISRSHSSVGFATNFATFPTVPSISFIHAISCVPKSPKIPPSVTSIPIHPMPGIFERREKSHAKNHPPAFSLFLPPPKSL